MSQTKGARTMNLRQQMDRLFPPDAEAHGADGNPHAEHLGAGAYRIYDTQGGTEVTRSEAQELADRLAKLTGADETETYEAFWHVLAECVPASEDGW